MPLNIPTKKTGDTLSAEELNSIASEINKKEDSITGKGLSSNDYTNGEKQKLTGLPAQVYSKTETYSKGETYSKIEVDDKVASAAQGLTFSDTETQVGVFHMSGTSGVIENPVYSLFSTLLQLPTTEGAKKDYTISNDPLGCNLYFAVDSFVVSSGEKLQSEMFLSAYEITKVYVTDDYQTKIVIRCKEATNLVLSAYLNVRYIKPYSEKIELDIATIESGISPASSWLA